MKKLKRILLVSIFLLPINVFADGNILGTGVLADSIGLTNIYYQHKLSKKSAATIGYASLNGTYLDATVELSSISLSYKGYFSEYANGGYWQLGASSININVTSGTLSTAVDSGILPVVLIGYESTLGSNFVLGVEGGFGTNQGLGIFGINASYMF